MTSPPAATCDTSVLVPALLPRHPRHRDAVGALGAPSATITAIPVHVMLECYSVLTRLPAPYRLSAADAGALVEALPMAPVTLPPSAQRTMVIALARAGVRGGAVYDGLVAATAAHHGLLLLTCDRRARTTYDALGVRYQLV